jgi:hypothetical protein
MPGVSPLVEQCRFGGVAISVLATGPKNSGFEPRQGDVLLSAIKIRSTPSFGWEVKPEVLCHKILQHVKDPLRYFGYEKARFSLLRPFLLLAPDISAGRTSREFWWTSQELCPAGIIITMAYDGHISPGGRTVGPLVAAVLRHCLAKSQSNVHKWPSVLDSLNKFMDACYVRNCVPGKFTTIFFPTLSSGTIFHVRNVQTNTLLNNVLNHIDTRNNTQNSTRSWTPRHCFVNNFSGSYCKRLALSHAAPAGRQEVGVA